MDKIEFGRFLRTRREALRPSDVGLRSGSRRRTPGLRREEVSQLADLSADYLARLERGDGAQASEQIVGALARALRLSLAERDHLLLLAGHQPPARGAASGGPGHVSPGLMRILDSLTETPAMVLGPLGETLAQNTTAVALFGDETRNTGPERLAAYRWFAPQPGGGHERLLYAEPDREYHSRVLVAQLHAATAVYGPESPAAALVADLQRVSREFATIWAESQVDLRHTEAKHFVHPEVGEIDLFCQTVVEPDLQQRLLVLTAEPGTANAEKLALLSVLGAQVVGAPVA